MVRIFYIALYTATAGALAAHWSHMRDQPWVEDLLGPQVAHAQSYSPAPPYPTAQAYPATQAYPAAQPAGAMQPATASQSYPVVVPHPAAVVSTSITQLPTGSGYQQAEYQQTGYQQAHPQSGYQASSSQGGGYQQSDYMGTSPGAAPLTATSRPAMWPGSAPSPAGPPVAQQMPVAQQTQLAQQVPAGQPYTQYAAPPPAAYTPPSTPAAPHAPPPAYGSYGVSPTPLFGAPQQVDPQVAPASFEFAGTPLEATRVLARIGTQEVILASEIMGSVNDMLAANADRIPPDRLEEVREQLMRQRLEQAVQTKVLLAEIRAKLPPEAFQQIEKRVTEQFNTVEVPRVMQQSKIDSVADLDARLRQEGGSLERERRSYVERMMAIGWVQQQVKEETAEATHEEMLAYYNANPEKYAIHGKAKWEQLVVRFDRMPNKPDAYATLAEAGNRVIHGAPLGEVARQMSHGHTASEGGQHAWTTKGSLVSEVLNEALFSLPVGQLSPILEDAQGYHIIRVVERVEPGRVPFSETQGEIREQILNERREKSINKYVTALRARTKVSTVFDEPAAPAAGNHPYNLPINPYSSAITP